MTLTVDAVLEEYKESLGEGSPARAELLDRIQPEEQVRTELGQADMAAEAALLARNGLHIIPLCRPSCAGSELKGSCGQHRCPSPGKHPLSRHGVLDATADLEQVAQVFGSGDRFNVGIRTGPESGVFAIDIDPRNGGWQTYNELIEEHGPLPPTATVVTGSFGLHIYFKLPEGVEIRKGKLGPGIDVLGKNSYAVAPPSLHQSGNPYYWGKGRAPWEVGFAEPPPWLTEKVTAEKLRASTRGQPRAVPEGERHTWLARQAGKLRAGGADAEALQTELSRLNASRCKPPLPDEEVAQLARDIGAKPVNTRPLRASAPALLKLQEHATDEEHWSKDLLYSEGKEGLKLVPCVQNAVTLLLNVPDWQGVIAFDEFSHTVVKASPPPWHPHDMPPVPPARGEPWTDEDSTRTMAWASREFGVPFPVDAISRAVAVVARHNGFHPVRDYLASLRWDGKYRLDTWLIDYLGAEDSPYHCLVGTWWLISAVARIMHPGCKADHVLVLEGPQGLQKSTALRTLAGDSWFSDSPIDIGSKDAAMQLRGIVIYELAELASLSKVEAARAKQFFTSAVDRYRPPYGREVQDVPRSCVFAGTVNEEAYLKDETGNRRYWPVACREIDIDGLESARDQLWAEAYQRYQEGSPWFPRTPEEHAMCAEQQHLRQRVDPWEESVADYLRLRHVGEVTGERILQEALGFGAATLTHAHTVRLGAIMKTLGWRRVQRRVGNRRVRLYLPPDELEDQDLQK